MAPERPLRILHLEDSPADHELAAWTLRRAGLVDTIEQVDTLAGFESAVASQRHDVVIADYHLPAFTALDAWRWLQLQPEPPPFVLLSGAIGETAAVDAVRLGIADYVLKDDMARLPRVVLRAIEVQEARRAKERAAAELALSERRLAELNEHLQVSIEQERSAIAREIHDDIGGSLAAIRFDVSWIVRNATDPQVVEHAAAAIDMLQHAIGASQRIQMNLRPPVLEQGLVAALQWLVQGFERRTAIPATVRTGMTGEPLSPDIQLVAYRTAQEALTNISKYAGARRVVVDLADSEGLLTLEITDDGCGMTPEQRDKPRSFGLRGLQERARTVGGWLDISSQPQRGTSIVLSVPLRAPATPVLEET